MICTVSTVKDTLPHLQRFIAGNLANGVDHLFVFLDDPDSASAEVRVFLGGHPQVTLIECTPRWWSEGRPLALNDRQRINANAVRGVLAECRWADWLFHVDADEIVLLDPEALAEVPAEVPVIQLRPIEAVSQKHWDGPVTQFKRLLGDADLARLVEAGVIDKPKNGSYFHGHTAGKPGVRPRSPIRLSIHKAVFKGVPYVGYEHPGLRHIHYDAYSGDDFVRKWVAMLNSGAEIGFRHGRRRVARRVEVALGQGLAPAALERRLMQIFARTTEDDLPTLRKLGVLEERDPLAGTHVPRSLSAEERADLADRVHRLYDAPKVPPHIAAAGPVAQGSA